MLRKKFHTRPSCVKPNNSLHLGELAATAAADADAADNIADVMSYVYRPTTTAAPGDIRWGVPGSRTIVAR